MLTRYTVLGRGAKRRTSSVLPRRIPQMSQRQNTSVRGKLARGAVSGRMWRVIELMCFSNFHQKHENLMVGKGSLNRLFPLANYINCDPLCDHSKSKAQTTEVQQPCHTLQMPPAEINYFVKQERRRTSVFVHTGRKKRFAQL